MASDSMSIGEYLRHTRLAKKLDLTAISQELHIRMEYLEALEQDQWDKLPGEVYGIGFLRSYARYLGVDAESLVNYRRRLSQQDPVRQPSAPQPRTDAPRDVPGRHRRSRGRVTRPPSSSRPGPSDASRGGGRAVFGAFLLLVVLFVAGIVLLHRPAAPVSATKPSPTSSHHVHDRRRRPVKRSHSTHHHRGTTSAAATAVTLTSNNPGQGILVYHVSDAPQVTVDFTGPCWVEYWENGVVQNAGTGGTNFVAGQFLKASASQSVELWVGTRNFNLVVDGQTVQLPDPGQKVFHITFQRS